MLLYTTAADTYGALAVAYYLPGLCEASLSVGRSFLVHFDLYNQKHITIFVYG